MEWGYGHPPTGNNWSAPSSTQLRRYLDATDMPPNAAVLSDLGITTLENRSKVYKLRLAQRLGGLDGHRLARQLWISSERAKDTTPWRNELRQLCQEFPEPEKPSDDWPRKEVEALNAREIADDVSTKSSLSLCANSFNPLVPLCTRLAKWNPKTTKLIFKLRSNTAPLAAFQEKTNGESPLCQICNSKKVEDLTHFLLECTALEEARKELRRVLPQPLSVGDTLGKHVEESAEIVAKMWKTRCICLTQARNTKRANSLLDYFQRLSFQPQTNSHTNNDTVAYKGDVGDEAWRWISDVSITGESDPDTACIRPGVNGGTAPTAK